MRILQLSFAVRESAETGLGFFARNGCFAMVFTRLFGFGKIHTTRTGIRRALANGWISPSRQPQIPWLKPPQPASRSHPILCANAGKKHAAQSLRSRKPVPWHPLSTQIKSHASYPCGPRKSAPFPLSSNPEQPFRLSLAIERRQPVSWMKSLSRISGTL